MEQQYERLPSSNADVERIIELEKDTDEISHDLCKRCGTPNLKDRSKVSQICCIFAFGMSTSVVLGIWIWTTFFSPQSVVPDMITEQKISKLLIPDERFNPWNQTPESDEAWGKMHSRFVMIEEPGRYGLPPSLGGKVEGSQVYAVAVFHQLHCLSKESRERGRYAVLKGGPEILNGPVDLPGHPAYKDLSGHVAHCFDYIRQSLMCSGDSILEAFLEADGKTLRQQGSSGWGVEHKCVDFDALSRWTEQYKDPGS